MTLEMEVEDGPVSKWENMDADILVRIFLFFGITEMNVSMAHVCRSWRFACCDALRSLDLSMMKSNFIKTKLAPYVYVDSRSDKSLTRLLKISLSLSRGSTSTIIFHYNLYISDDQLIYIAERTPRLKRLVMPAWNRIRRTGICRAIHIWEELESLTMPTIAHPAYLFEEIFRSCRKFAELKIMGPCNLSFASSIATYLPNLKVLSLRCSAINKDGLLIILEDLRQLEVLNISHCVLVEVPPPPAPKKFLTTLDESILRKASKLKTFLTCMRDSCLMCQRTRNDGEIIKWSRYDDQLWKLDEVNSLAIK